MLGEEDYERELAEASNAVVDLVKAGEFDQAERAAHDLLSNYPDVHDGYDRLGMIYEARGDKARAAEYYRQALAFVREHADDYEPQFEELYLKLITRCEAPTSTTPEEEA
jgi:tetratricopeptide (TPR) repeat protein